MTHPDITLTRQEDGTLRIVIDMVLPGPAALHLAQLAENVKLAVYMPGIVADLKREYGFET